MSFNEKIFDYSIFESCRDKLQEYVMKNKVYYLEKSIWPSYYFQTTIQGQTSNTILFTPRNHIIFV